MNELRARIEELEREIADLRSRFPAHSLKPPLLRRLEDLEDELAALRERERETGPAVTMED